MSHARIAVDSVAIEFDCGSHSFGQLDTGLLYLEV
jgi:hypothetical protein